MKKIIAGLLCAATVSGAVFAQEATLYNKLGTTAVKTDPVEDAKPYMGDIYDEVRGTYESEKFSVWGQVKLSVLPVGTKGLVKDQEVGPWEEGIRTGADLEFAAAFRPVEFLEVIAGNVAGEEGLWSAAYTPGFYGYGSDVHYGVSKWASGEGAIVAFRGAGVGVDGLTIGWNVLQPNDILKKKDDTSKGWNTAFAVTYAIPELVSVGVAAKIDTAEEASQEFGFGAELTAVENLKVGLGIDLKTENIGHTFGVATLWNPVTEENESVVATEGWEKGVLPILNVGAEYNFAGMNLPLTVGADLGMVLGSKEVGSVKYMPMLFGGFVAYSILDNLKVDARIAFEGNMADDSDYSRSAMVIEPRVWFNLTEADELRLDVPITNISMGKFAGDSNNTGFAVELYWKHNF